MMKTKGKDRALVLLAISLNITYDAIPRDTQIETEELTRDHHCQALEAV